MALTCRALERDHDDHDFTPRVQRVLQQGLAVRERWRNRRLSAHGVAVARGHLVNRLNTLIDDPGSNRRAQLLTNHLAIQFPAVFTFLLDPAVDAANWRAEQALRPAVITRKVWGGTRTPTGAITQQLLASVLRTSHQRQLDAGALITEMLRARDPIVPFGLNGGQR